MKLRSQLFESREYSPVDGSHYSMNNASNGFCNLFCQILICPVNNYFTPVEQLGPVQLITSECNY